MAGRSALKASDADRDRVTELLRRAATEGRLLTEELEERLEAALSARTYGQLDVLVADLPRPAHRRRRSARGLMARGVALALLAPLVLGVAVAAVTALAGLAALWGVWLALAWWLFGFRGRRGPRWAVHALPPRGRRGRRFANAQRRRGLSRSPWA